MHVIRYPVDAGPCYSAVCGRPAPVAWAVEPVSSIFCINRFNPLSDHHLDGNSVRKCFAPYSLFSLRNFIAILSSSVKTIAKIAT